MSPTADQRARARQRQRRQREQRRPDPREQAAEQEAVQDHDRTEQQEQAGGQEQADQPERGRPAFTPTQFLGLATTGKWSELQALMAEMMTAAPYWRTSGTDGVLYPPDDGWHPDWDYQFRLGSYKHIEWCELYPRPDDASLTLDDLEQVCDAIGFEIEVLGDRIRVLGYRRLS
jgi:hypothetical protein